VDVLYEPARPTRADTSISSFGWHGIDEPMSRLQLVTGAAIWPAAGLVIYCPIVIPVATTITRLWWSVGVAAGNVDAGIYNEAGTLLGSAGTTVVAGSNTFQQVDVTDFTLQRGRYYLGIVASDAATYTNQRSNVAAGVCQSLGLLQQASVTLPLATNASPATFAAYAQAYIPLVGAVGRIAVAI
jgi:hypothetical protein